MDTYTTHELALNVQAFFIHHAPYGYNYLTTQSHRCGTSDHLHIGHAMINFICATRNWRINRQKLTMTAAIELIITPSKKNTKMWVTSGEQVNPGYITSTVAAPLCLYKVCTPHGQVWRSCAHLNKRQAAWDSGSWPPSLAQLRPQSFTKQKHDKDKVQALSVSQKNYDLWRREMWNMTLLCHVHVTACLAHLDCVWLIITGHDSMS